MYSCDAIVVGESSSGGGSSTDGAGSGAADGACAVFEIDFRTFWDEVRARKQVNVYNSLLCPNKTDGTSRSTGSSTGSSTGNGVNGVGAGVSTFKKAPRASTISGGSSAITITCVAGTSGSSGTASTNSTNMSTGSSAAFEALERESTGAKVANFQNNLSNRKMAKMMQTMRTREVAPSSSVYQPSSAIHICVQILLFLAIVYAVASVPYYISFSYSFGKYAVSKTGQGGGIGSLLHVKDLMHLSVADTFLCVLGWVEVYLSM
mgnify:CR=1 FL=1